MRGLFKMAIDFAAAMLYNVHNIQGTARSFALCNTMEEIMSLLCDIVVSEVFQPKTNLPMEVVYLLRVLLGGAFGLIFGIERSRRQKEAGMATHFIVGASATLFTCISIMMKDIGDGERIAAQVVSGIGFLGAGMIFFRRENLRGLTTAAGIWATAAVGMCVAVGMYWVALGAAALIISVQIILHTKFIRRNRLHLLLVQMEYSDEIKTKLMEFFGFETFHRFKVTASDEKYAQKTKKSEASATESDEQNQGVSVSKKLIAETVIYPTKNCSADEIAKFMRENPEIYTIERLEDL